ncbi:E3 ubiquitin/ISG15 ligase TRIM25-like isoform X2 [Melanotaenia boesemani]|uniref:E3 ubiquitin/ISG15 ligase TRIM25-like isoform X2 n=1 Tax=Melanotaenia boesemani TaxID=1250792 RepID=UPI001C04821C|nr:E3 ubiquitin/ISG15 ligase TRIM25-like isoform X2 [Melanotaenia boesemani]
MSVVDEFLSLLNLEDELTCSICLSPFNCPVTIPCGHNFCQDCLLSTWKEDDYSCPQCRTFFATKPELKKNTVLCTVVETFSLRSSKSTAGLQEEENKPEEEEKKEDVIRCDTCMEAEAAKTCLTCMASFCEEHLRPHRENPTFRPHHLIDPVGDLSEHICPEHHKLMEHFCSQHDRLICSLCLQQVHKGCSFISPEEQRNMKKSEFREKLDLLDGKIARTESVLFQMNDMQSQLKDAANRKKTALADVYQQIRDMLAKDERAAQHEVDCELEFGQTKLLDFSKRFTENSERMKKARENINGLLSQSQTSAFLQASFDLPKVVKFDPYPPRINLDSKRVMSVQTFATVLRESLTETFAQPFEARGALFKPGENEASASEPAGAERFASQPESAREKPAEQRPQPRSTSPGRPPTQPIIQTFSYPVYIPSQPTWSTSHFAQGPSHHFPRGQLFGGQNTHKSDAAHKPHHKPDKKPQSAPGGQKPAGQGSNFSKQNKPKSHPPSGKPAGHHPGKKK